MPFAVQDLLTLALFVMTAGIAGLSAYAMRRRRIPGAVPFAALCAVTAFYTAGYGMEIQQVTVTGIDFWSRFEYIGLPLIPTCWLLIAIFRSRSGWYARPRQRRLLVACLCGFSGVTTLFRFLSGWMPIHYGAMWISDNGYFPVLQFEKGPWYLVYQAYYIGCGIVSILIHLSNAKSGTAGNRASSRFLGWISLLPLCVAPLNLFGWFPLGLDSGPFFALFTYLIIAYALFRHNVMNLIPLARDRVFDWIGDGVIVLGEDLEMLDFNRAALSMFPALSRPEGLPDARKAFLDAFSTTPTFAAAFLQWYDQPRTPIAPDGSSEILVFRCDLPGAEPEGMHRLRHFQIRVTELGGKGEMNGILLLISDITEQIESMRSLERMARTDSLTGLENRGSFLEGMAAVCAGSRRGMPAGAVLLLDLDHFKKINDQFGHLAGDAVLRRLAGILRTSLREQDLVGRYGGEEFIAFLPGAPAGTALQVAERIRLAVAGERMEWETHAISFRASIGVAVADGPLDGAQAYEAWIGHADEALYQAKRAGRNRTMCWKPDMVAEPAATAAAENPDMMPRQATGSSASSSKAR